MKLKILSVKNKPFTTDDGDTRDYFWYRAERVEDGVTLQFGSKDGEHEIGKVFDLAMDKSEGKDQKGRLVYRYKEVIEKD